MSEARDYARRFCEILVANGVPAKLGEKIIIDGRNKV